MSAKTVIAFATVTGTAPRNVRFLGLPKIDFFNSSPMTKCYISRESSQRLVMDFKAKAQATSTDTDTGTEADTDTDTDRHGQTD